MSTTESGTVSMELHKDFEKRFEEMSGEMDRRLKALESNIDALHEISNSVARLAEAMEGMRTEQHEQRGEMRSIHTAVTSINIKYVERKINEHDTRFDDHARRIRELEQKPQDSHDHENRLRGVEEHVHTTHNYGPRIDALENRVTTMEQEPAEMYKKMKWGIVAAICSAAGLAVWNGIQALLSAGGAG